MAVITKGVQLWYKQEDGLPIEGEKDSTKGILLPGLQEFGDVTSTAGGAASRDKIEVTTLADDRHMYVDGLIAEDEANEIEFKFLFNEALFQGINAVDYTTGTAEIPKWTLEIPVGKLDSVVKYATFTFEGRATATMNGAGVNEAVVMTVTVTPTSTINFVKSA